MRPRPLATDNEPLRADAFARQAVSATRAFEETIKAPGLGGLAMEAIEVGQARGGGVTNEQMREFDDSKRERKLRQRYLENLLVSSTDGRRRQDYSDELASMAGQDSIALQAVVQEAIDEGRLVSKEELNKKYAGFLEFDRPTTELAARLLYENKKEETIRNAIIETGPGGLSGVGVAVLGSVVIAATDPVDLASAFIPVVGQTGRVAAIARFGRVRGRAAVGAVEGTVGAAITEPAYYGFSQQLQLDYTMGDALLNVGAGTLLGGGLGAAAGVVTRRKVNVDQVRNLAEPETSVRTDLEMEPAPAALPEVGPKAPQEISAQAARASAFYEQMNGRTSAELAIRQVALDQSVNVSAVMPKVVKRPETLVEFVRSRGGIADTLPGSEGKLAEIGFPPETFDPAPGKRTAIANINNPGAKDTLEAMAVRANKAGFIATPEVNDLLGALSREFGGEPVFSARNKKKVESWIKYSSAEDAAGAEVTRRNDIKRGARELGFDEITDGEAAVISSVMARNNSNLETAIEGLYTQTGRLTTRAVREAARLAKNDPLTNARASQTADRVQDEIDLDQYINRSMATIDQMRLGGEMTPEYEAVLASLADLDARVQAYDEVMTAATICTARS
jgi:hypothetical protein